MWYLQSPPASFWVWTLVAIVTLGTFADSQWDQYRSRGSSRNQRPRYGSYGNRGGELYPPERSSRDSYERSGYDQPRHHTSQNYNQRRKYNRPSYNSRPRYTSQSSYSRPNYNSRPAYNSHSTHRKKTNYDRYTSNSYNKRNTYNEYTKPNYDSYYSNRGHGYNNNNNNNYNNNYRPTTSRHRPSHDTYHSKPHTRNQHTRSSVGQYSRPPSSVHWYRPSSAYRQRTRRPRTRNHRGYYQADYDLGKDDYHKYNYPKIPTYDSSHSQDTSDYYSYKSHKISCYQCNYKPGKPYWKLVTQRKSVPDPYYPYRYMSVKVKKYVRKQGIVGAGWDKCQGALTRRSAELHGIYQEASCEGSCYVRTDKNGMVYRGCYAGEWKVNPHKHGCSYQAGSLYCFCRGDRCNGFVAPLSYSDPYPSGYSKRGLYPYPADYPRKTRYDPYPELSSYRQSHPIRRQHHRYRRAADVGQTLAENEVELYERLLGVNATSGNTQTGKLERSCFQCSPSEGCKGPVTTPGKDVTTDGHCYGHCYVKLHADKGVSRGCFAGEAGVNQHLIGCHVQQGATYCFCRGTNCNNFTVTMETPQNEAKAAGVTSKPTNSTQVKVKDAEVKILEPELDVKYPVALYYIEFPSG